MKKIRQYGKAVLALIAVIVIGATMIWVALAKAEPADRYSSSWRLIRAKNSEDGADFATVYDLTGVGTTNGNFASKDSSTVASGGPYQIRSSLGASFSEYFSPGQKWMFAFCGENFNNVDDTFSFNLVGWSRDNGMIQNICEGSCTLGTQAVVTYPNGDDALGATISSVAAVYTHADTKFTMTDELDDLATGMLVRVTGSGFTNGILQVTTVTSNDSFECSGISSTANCTATVQSNPAFWADTITLDETTKWQASGADPNTMYVINNADNECANLVVDLTGLEWIQFVIYDADAATGDEAGNISVYGRRY